MSGQVEGPGAGDRIASVAVSGDRYLSEAEQLDPVRGDGISPAVRRGEGPADVFPPPAVQCPEPPDHSPPDEAGQAVQGVLAHCMLEVVSPAAHDLIEPDQHVPEFPLRFLVRQGTDLCLQRPDGPVADEGVDVPVARPPLAFPLDAEAEEVEPLAHVRDAGLGW
jgi:hypothetical protein